MTWTRCEICQGLQTVGCPECQGAPLEGPIPSEATEPCSHCGGSGRVPCPGCLGAGFVDMPTYA